MEYTIIEQVKIRLGHYHLGSGSEIVFDNPEEDPLINVLVEQNRNFVVSALNPPEHYSPGDIETLLAKHEVCIAELVLYDFVKQGGEFEKSHSEPGTSRSWINKEEILCYFGVVPFARII